MKSDKESSALDLLHWVRDNIPLHREAELEPKEKFNVFTFFRIQWDEVWTHSNLLTELLRPNGRHGIGSVPLRTFLDRLGVDTPASDWEIEKEKWFGQERWDIFLHHPEKKRLILIENKINHTEGQNQVGRYIKAARQFNYPDQNIHFIYLTPGGKQSLSIGQTDPGDIHLHNWSYYRDIRDWLADCLQAEDWDPFFRGLINQYRDLHLTFAGRQQKQKAMKDIADHIYEENLLAETKAIHDAWDEVRFRIQYQFWQDLEEALQAAGLQVLDQDADRYTKRSVHRFYYGMGKDYGIGVQVGEVTEGNPLVVFVGIGRATLYLKLRVRNKTNGKYQSDRTVRENYLRYSQLEKVVKFLQPRTKRFLIKWGEKPVRQPDKDNLNFRNFSGKAELQLSDPTYRKKRVIKVVKWVQEWQEVMGE